MGFVFRYTFGDVDVQDYNITLELTLKEDFSVSKRKLQILGKPIDKHIPSISRVLYECTENT